MKNLKKWSILAGIIVIILIIPLYYLISNKNYEEIEIENSSYTEERSEEVEEKMLILHIDGEVKNPGVVEVKDGARIINVIEAAGGVTEEADLNKINLAYVVSDGQKIHIPSKNDDENTHVYDGAGENIIDNIKTNSLVNINTATQTELEALNGIGPSTALKIIEYRKKNGKFKTIEEIKEVSGIGTSKYELIKDKICI